MAQAHEPAPSIVDEGPSKTQRKRDMLALQDLGEALVKLPEDRLQQLRLPERLRDAVQAARRISKFGALRRQFQYIGRLMREEADAPAIARELDTWNKSALESTARLHELERWRARLLEDDLALGEFASAHPGCDTQRLRSLIRSTRREQTQGLPPKSFRELFQILRESIADTHAPAARDAPE